MPCFASSLLDRNPRQMAPQILNGPIGQGEYYQPVTCHRNFIQSSIRKSDFLANQISPQQKFPNFTQPSTKLSTPKTLRRGISNHTRDARDGARFSDLCSAQRANRTFKNRVARFSKKHVVLIFFSSKCLTWNMKKICS